MEDKLSYCTLIYNGDEILQAISDVSAAGYKGIEFYPKDWQWGFSNLGVQEFAKYIENAGIEISAVFGGVLSELYDDVYEAANAACALSAKYVFAVSPVSGTVDRKTCIKIIEDICDILARYGLTLVIHNHAGTYMESLSTSYNICSSIKRENFGLCLDSVHFALFDDNIEEKIDDIFKYIKYIHLKDMKKTRQDLYKTVPKEEWRWGELDHLAAHYTDLDDGVVDNRALAKRLKKLGYSGWWIAEIEKQQIDKQSHANNNYNILSSYIRG